MRTRVLRHVSACLITLNASPGDKPNVQAKVKAELYEEPIDALAYARLPV